MGLDIADAAWVAGFLDGEGYFSIYSRGSAGKNKPDCRPRALIRVNQAGIRAPLERLEALLGGSIHEASRRTNAGLRVWGWQLQSAAGMREFLPLIIPHMVVKGRQAELVLKFAQTVEVRGSRNHHLSESQWAERYAIANELKELRKMIYNQKEG